VNGSPFLLNSWASKIYLYLSAQRNSMDITREIYDAENALREFLHQSFSKKYGELWTNENDLTKKLMVKWTERKAHDEKGANAIKGKEKAIQYANLEELRELIAQCWSDEMGEVFEDKQTLDTFLKILNDYRNPDSRRRELFRHQKHLLLGIAGDIRSRIILHRSKQEIGGPYPRIESVKDNLGNLWTPGNPRRLRTSNTLYAGDELEFIITAYDPEEKELGYRCQHGKWQANNIVLVPIDRRMVEKQGLIHLMIRSDRKHHAYRMGFDDRVTFEYEIIVR
jgi:hypothetical protein